MTDFVGILSVFHDGSIVEIRGSLPEITCRIEIKYLREMFSQEGDSFLAKMAGCELIEFDIWEKGITTRTLSEIESEQPEILSIEQNGEMANVLCTTGMLRIRYKEVSFQLDTGEFVSFTDLEKASNKYWGGWEQEADS